MPCPRCVLCFRCVRGQTPAPLGSSASPCSRSAWSTWGCRRIPPTTPLNGSFAASLCRPCRNQSAYALRDPLRSEAIPGVELDISFCVMHMPRLCRARSEMRCAGVERLALVGDHCGVLSQAESLTTFMKSVPDVSSHFLRCAARLRVKTLPELLLALSWNGPPELLSMFFCLYLVRRS